MLPLGILITHEVPGNPFNLGQLSIVFKKVSFILGLAIFLLFSLKVANAGTRKTLGFIGIMAFYGEIVISGRTGISLLDFGMPAFAMLVSLNTIDAFFLRPVTETRAWGLGLATTHLFAFPNEKPTAGTSPFFSNLGPLITCAAKYSVVNGLLYVIPSPKNWSQIRPFSAAFFFHSMMVGFAVLFSLASFIEIVIRLIGIIFNVEQNPMFNNPCGASNIREFWGRWNLAIKNGLSRVFFHFSAPPVAKVNGNIDEKVVAVASSLSKDELTLRQRNGTNGKVANHSAIESASIIRTRKPFLPKAISAVITFAVSGLFHEAMNAFAFKDPRSGETVAFFLIHGLAAVFYSYLERYHPSLPRSVPAWLGIIIVNSFCVLTAPFFTGVFLQAGFFEQFKAFGIFGPVADFYWVFGDGYGGHLVV